MSTERGDVEALMAEWRAVEADAATKVADIKRRLAALLGVSPAPKATPASGNGAAKKGGAAPKWRAVIDMLARVAEVDAATVLETVKAEGERSRADRLKLIRSQFDYLEKHKGFIEKVENKRGWWRLTAAGRAAIEDKGVAH